jgi:NSS family neurotransmitter:Na+ symporter
MATPAVGAAGHEHWSSRTGFLLAAIGSAVGLGNFWRFPYQAGESGGGAFVLVYLACILLIATPLVMAELMIGRRGQKSAVGSSYAVAKEAGQSGGWAIIGWMGMIGGFLILSFYSVIGGLVLAYIPEAMLGSFSGKNAAEIGEIYATLQANPVKMTIFHALFMGITGYIVAKGLQRGIEPAVKVLMPLLFLLMVLLLGYAIFEGAFMEGVRFLFTPDFSKINATVFVDAIGHAFFSVGVALAILITYGSYLGPDMNLPRAGIIIALSDTGVAIVAGLIIFPIVFAHGVDPAAGPGLLFETLPIAFGQMFGGVVFGSIFFILMFVAALTSSISILEIAGAYADERLGVSRTTGAILAASAAFLVGMATVLSFNVWSGWYPLDALTPFRGLTPFGLIDTITQQFMLPLAGILIAVFAGWALPKTLTQQELGLSAGAYQVWSGLLRYLAPIAIGAVWVMFWYGAIFPG